MMSVIKRPIGVWFSLALLILVSCCWLGYAAGVRFASARVRRQQETTGPRLSPELATLPFMRLLRMASTSNPEKLRSSLLFETGRLEALVQEPKMQDVASVVNLDLAMDYVELAIVEERANNQSEARAHMQSGQNLFRSLGWQDDSEDTLRGVAQRELDRWTVPSHSGGARK